MKPVSNSDDDYYDWLTHYNTTAAAFPTQLGLTAGEVSAIDAVWSSYHYARIAEDNAEAAWHASVVAKDEARANAGTVVNATNKKIQANPDVTNVLKEDLGITVPKTTRTPSPVPVTAPSFQRVDTSVAGWLALYIVDATTPDSRAKPKGVSGCEIRAQVGGTSPTDRDTMVTIGIAKRIPFRHAFALEDVGKTVYFAIRWLNTRNEPGPWSPMLTSVVPG